CVESTRELESVDEPELVVARAPEDERRAAQLVQLLPGVVGHDRPGCADRVARQPRALEEALYGLGRQDQRVGRAPVAEDRVAQKRAAGDGIRPRRDEPTGPDDPEDSQSIPRSARRRRDP